MPFCRRRRAETQGAGKTPKLQQKVLRTRHTASEANVEKEFIWKKVLWKNNLKFVMAAPILYANLIIIIIIIISSEKR
jgi:hypothetical protein